jgi:hypothetical protein
MIERLRDGLFDPTAINRLAMEEIFIQRTFIHDLQALEKGSSQHLCICGSYGQGKSHMLNKLNQHALSQGYATSFVQLDLREVPFHQFPTIYHALMKRLTLPDGQQFAMAWKKSGTEDVLTSLNTMPHRFKMIFRSMLHKNKSTKQYKISKKIKPFLPKDSFHLLEKALLGDEVPLVHLKGIFKDQGLEGYKDESLVCKGNLPYVQMVQALGDLLKAIGYKGLVVFFDEAESIAQVRLGQRAKSYDILNQFFNHQSAVYTVFAFTADFFDKVNREPYDDEKQRFAEHYAEQWKDLKIMHLQDFSSQSWDLLQDRLIQAYAEAYRIDFSPQMTNLKKKLQDLLKKLKDQETRFKLKALVHQLDIETQFL